MSPESNSYSHTADTPRLRSWPLRVKTQGYRGRKCNYPDGLHRLPLWFVTGDRNGIGGWGVWEKGMWREGWGGGTGPYHYLGSGRLWVFLRRTNRDRSSSTGRDPTSSRRDRGFTLTVKRDVSYVDTPTKSPLQTSESEPRTHTWREVGDLW